MGKKEEIYYWKPRDGKGALKIDRLYTDGEKIPHELMHAGTLATLIKSGDIKTTPFDVANTVEKDSVLKKEVKVMEKKITELEDAAKLDATKITELEEKVKELTPKAK